MYTVEVGEVGSERGHYVGAYITERGARIAAGKALAPYSGDGWACITDGMGWYEIVGRP